MLFASMFKDEFHKLMERHYRGILEEKINKLPSESNILFFTQEEIRFFRFCNDIKNKGYRDISAEYIEKYLTRRDKIIRGYIEDLHG